MQSFRNSLASTKNVTANLMTVQPKAQTGMMENVLTFQDIDTDHSGDITLAELRDAMRRANPWLKDEHVALRFNQLDVNGDQNISQEEYDKASAILEIETDEDGINSGKTFRLHAETIDEMKEWGQAIEEAVIAAKAAAEQVYLNAVIFLRRLCATAALCIHVTQ